MDHQQSRRVEINPKKKKDERSDAGHWWMKDVGNWELKKIHIKPKII
jgi:hypothetical protein